MRMRNLTGRYERNALNSSPVILLSHCAESESLESRLACADSVRQLCVDPAWCKVCVLLLRLSSD